MLHPSELLTSILHKGLKPVVYAERWILNYCFAMRSIKPIQFQGKASCGSHLIAYARLSPWRKGLRWCANLRFTAWLLPLSFDLGYVHIGKTKPIDQRNESSKLVIVVALSTKEENLPSASSEGDQTKIATWLILPVVIRSSQRLSHACLSIYIFTLKLRTAHYISYSSFDSPLLIG